MTTSGDDLKNYLLVLLALPEDVRHTVFKRDNWSCRRCGEADYRNISQHHIKERSQGGLDTEENLVVLCFRHHRAIHDGKLAVKLINGKAYFKAL